MYGADFILDDFDLVALNSCSRLARVASSTGGSTPTFCMHAPQT
jgi:hypothetical protein